MQILTNVNFVRTTVRCCLATQQVRTIILSTVPSNTKVFYAVYDYADKADLSKGYSEIQKNQQQQMGATTHFAEIIKQQ